MRVLLVEDEPELAASLCLALRRHGLVIDHAANLAEAGRAVDTHAAAYDAVLLDRQLPDGDGLALVARLRRAGNSLPVSVLTARGALADRLAGLDGGADDYLGKPFAVEEVVARLRAVLRRPAQWQAEVVRVGRLAFDLGHREASINGRVLELPRRELLVLDALARRCGRTVLRGALEQAVYGFDDEIQSNALDTHVSRLRRKLGEAGAGVDLCSVRGVGYLLRAA